MDDGVKQALHWHMIPPLYWLLVMGLVFVLELGLAVTFFNIFGVDMPFYFVFPSDMMRL